MPLHPVILFSFLIFPLGRLSQEPVEDGFTARKDTLPFLPTLEVEGEENQAEPDDPVKDHGHVDGDKGEEGVEDPVPGHGPVAGEARPEVDPGVPSPEEVGDEGAEPGDVDEGIHGKY